MKLIHTGDWHLGDRLGRVDRGPDLRRAIERIARYCDEHQVDGLLVAGDIFSELPRADGLRECIAHLQTTFASFFQRGGTILAVTGNHDNEGFCRTLRHAMDLAAPAAAEFGNVVAPGRFYLADAPTLLRLFDQRTGATAQFILMPYPTPSAYFAHEAQQRYTNLEERAQFLQAAFTMRLADIRADARFDSALPTILVAHTTVQGAQADHLFHLDVKSDVVCPDEIVNPNYAYVALGHIHKPHQLGSRPNVRYCGSIERLDVGEAIDQKSVVLLELTSQGLVSEPRTLPLDATPIYEVAIHEPKIDIPKLPESRPDHDRALVNLKVRYRAGEDTLETILAELATIFPRWYARDWTEVSEIGSAISPGPDAGKSFDAVVRDYLDAELAHHDEETRTAVLARMERLLAPGSGT